MLLAVLRFLHGAGSSAINPLAFGIVADYFPADKRSTANSILSAANFVGIALSSLTIILIKSFGWKASYLAMGCSGILGALLTFLFVRDPKRGQFDVPLTPEEQAKKDEKAKAKENKAGFWDTMKDMTKNDVCRNIFIAGFIRSLGSMVVTAYVPVFF